MPRYIEADSLDAIKTCFVEDCFEANKDVAQLSAKEVEAEQKEFVSAYGLRLEEVFRHVYQYGWNNAIEMAKRARDRVPTADVVEVVRCKDCVHYTEGYKDGSEIWSCECKHLKRAVVPVWFCADGERREDETKQD